MATVKQWASWERRAKTILGKSEALMADMIADLGVDDAATDYADSVNEAAENLVDICHRQKKARGGLK